MNPTAYPLAWPAGRPRTPAADRKRAPFNRKSQKPGQSWVSTDSLTVADALKRLDAELGRLGAIYPLLSSNLETRLDGRPRSDKGQPSDPGVCAYFTLNGKPFALACDRYDRVADNIAALAAHVEATRAIARHGVASASETLRAFEALPAPPSAWELLGLSPPASRTQVEAAYRAKAKKAHPDRPGGSHDRMAALSAARDTALSEAAS